MSKQKIKTDSKTSKTEVLQMPSAIEFQAIRKVFLKYFKTLNFARWSQEQTRKSKMSQGEREMKYTLAFHAEGKKETD